MSTRRSSDLRHSCSSNTTTREQVKYHRTPTNVTYTGNKIFKSKGDAVLSSRQNEDPQLVDSGDGIYRSAVSSIGPESSSLRLTDNNVGPLWERTNIAVATVVISPSTVSVQVTGLQSLNAVITPSDASDKNTIWSSNDISIATVDASSVIVTGVSEGKTFVTATVDGKTATRDIKVVAATSILTSKESLTGITATLDVWNIGFKSFTGDKVEWSIGDCKPLVWFLGRWFLPRNHTR